MQNRETSNDLNINRRNSIDWPITVSFFIFIFLIFIACAIFYGAFICSSSISCINLSNTFLSFIGYDLDVSQSENLPLSVQERLAVFGFAIPAVTAIASAVLTSVVSLCAAFLVFTRINVKQSQAIALETNINRLNILIDLEEYILKLFDEEICSQPKKLNLDDKYFNLTEYDECLHNYRWSLRQTLRWDIEFNDHDQIHRQLFGKNMVLISSDGTRISSMALHNTVMWYRRLFRAYQADIITIDDLTHLWRQILPFCMSCRYSYLHKYFSSDDFYFMKAICLHTVSALIGRNFLFPENVTMHLDKEFERDLCDFLRAS